ncbi:anti-sigma factor domain-containing protein [Deinococcus aerophilus]|uniref:Regulator of SigK n=1 Tax=Deinococcus aerophilus TaxID=522488 RepID=A0ABQ2GTW0_9DEIO|nr:anti-sigma factor [Deinococcus aerophilus]GGM10480.1 anti-sigma E factor [Deinococcus aerophilus]
MTINPDDLLALALGSLSPQEEARVRAALQQDPEALAQYRADFKALHSLPDALPLAEVPAGAEDRLMARLRAEQAGGRTADAQVPVAAPSPAPVQPTARVWPWRIGGLLALAAAAALFFVLRPAGDPLTRYAAQPGAVTQPLIGADQAQIGQVVRLADGSAYLYLTAAPPSDRVYQLWQIQGTTPVSLGVMDGQGTLVAQAPTGITLAVSVEPPGGSDQPTTTPILVQQL